MRIGDWSSDVCSSDLGLLRGFGHTPHIVEGEDPDKMHQAFAAALDRCLDDIADIQQRARSGERDGRPRWPMLVLRSPKGWTGPPEVDGRPVEGPGRSHPVPFAAPPRAHHPHAG